MITMVSQITSLTIVYSTVYSGADQRKHQSSASLAFVWGIHRWPHKGPVTRKMFPFDDAIMKIHFKHGTRFYCYCYKFPGIAARCLICQFADGLRSAPPRNMHMFVLCCILSLFDYALAYILYCYIAVIIMLFLCYDVILALHWRHNDHVGVSNHQPRDCLLNRLFRRRTKKTSKLRVTGLCVGNSLGPVNSPHKGPVTRKMSPFDDVIMGKPSRPLFTETTLFYGHRNPHYKVYIGNRYIKTTASSLCIEAQFPIWKDAAACLPACTVGKIHGVYQMKEKHRSVYCTPLTFVYYESVRRKMRNQQ